MHSPMKAEGVSVARERFVVAGHVCVDITPKFKEQAVPRSIEKIMVPGKLVAMEGVAVSAGGAVSNTGLALKKFGAHVTLMGKVGEDDFGRMLLEIFDRSGVAEGMIVDANARTSYSVVIAPPHIDRIFLHDTGVNDTFCCDDIDYDTMSDVALFHFGYPPIMREMYRDGAAQTVEMFKRVKLAGAMTSLDMVMVDADSDAMQTDWDKALRAMLPYVDFFTPSIEELCSLLDRERYKGWLEKAGNEDVIAVLEVERDVMPFADRLLEMGAKIVVIKCGSAGMLLKTADATALQSLRIDAVTWSNLTWFEKSYRPDRIVSATGAGDVSIAAFLKSAVENRDPYTCMRLATAAGASCVEAHDALSGVSTLEQLAVRIQSGWEKN